MPCWAQEAADVRLLVLVDDADEHDVAPERAAARLQHRVLLEAGHAPGGPEVEDHGLCRAATASVTGAPPPIGGQREGGRGPADERRVDRVRIAAEVQEQDATSGTTTTQPGHQDPAVHARGLPRPGAGSRLPSTARARRDRARAATGTSATRPPAP